MSDDGKTIDPELLALLDAYQDEALDESGCRRLLALLQGDAQLAAALADELGLRRAIAEELRDRSSIDMQRAVRAEIGAGPNDGSAIRRGVIARIHRRRRPSAHWAIALAAGLACCALILWQLAGSDIETGAAPALAVLPPDAVALSGGARLLPGESLYAERPRSLRQGDGSQIEVDGGNLRLEQAGPAWRWAIDEGRFSAAVSHGSDFVVRTPHGTASVHGTKFLLQSSGSGCLLGVREGLVRLTAADSGASVDCGAGEMAILGPVDHGQILQHWQRPASQLLHVDCRFGGRDPLTAVQLKQQFAGNVPEEDEEIVHCGGRGLPLLNDRYIFTEPLGAQAVNAIRETGAVSIVLHSTVSYPKRLAGAYLPLFQFFVDDLGAVPACRIQLGLMPPDRPHTTLIVINVDGKASCWVDGRPAKTQGVWNYDFKAWPNARLLLSWMLDEEPKADYLNRCTRVLHALEIHAGALRWNDIRELP